MSKRMGFKFNQPRSKMPKLDITISSGQRITAVPSNMNQSIVIPNTPAQSEDLWGEDEEDEIFVLASQAVEKVQADAAIVITQSMNIRDHDMSYTRFRQDARAVQSTQLKAIDEFDDDEELFSNVPDFVSNGIQTAVRVESKENNGQQVQQNQPNQQSSSSRTSTDNTARKHKEQLQTEYYAEKIKAQKKDIEILRDTLNKANRKCTTKEGEASTLRYEVDSKSREIEKMRRERMEENVEMETKYSERIAALERKIEEQRSELEFKNIEILHKRSRRSLNDSIVSEPESSITAFELHNLFKLHTHHPAPNDPLNIPAAEFLATKSLERYRGISERDFDTLNSLNALQSIYNGVKSKNLRALDENMMKEFNIISKYFIRDLKNYASKLSLRTPTKYDAAMEFKLLSEEMTKTNSTNETMPPLDQKLIYERQMLAVIALLCTDYPNMTHSLLFEKCEEDSANDNDDDEMDGDNRIGSFVDILTEVLSKIGHSKTLSSHKSLIESTSLLLVALAKTYIPSETNDILLLQLFHAIVFCEPNLSSLSHLSEFLEMTSENQSSCICSRFCIDETCNVISFQQYKIIRFSIQTCPLQMFACLLQISFTPYGSNGSLDHSNQVNTVANITIRMMKFVRNCFNRRVNWLFRKSRLFPADDTQLKQVSYCYCYIMSCVIALLHFCINSWMENHKILEMKLLKTLFTMGSLFLYDIIKKHYEPKVLSLGGFPVKNRLQAIYDWIMYYFPLFRMSTISEYAIKSVKLLQILQLNEPQMLPIGSQPQTADQIDSILIDSFDDFLL